MSRRPFTRRRFLGTTAAASAATIGFPYIRTSHAAGSLALGFWDHWVPGANDTLTKLCQDWGEKEKVDVKIDYITSQGNKNMLTITAESQARSGHDILAHPAWYALTYARQLEPLDDVMNPLIKQHGKVAGGQHRQSGAAMREFPGPGSKIRRIVAQQRQDVASKHNKSLRRGQRDVVAGELAKPARGCLCSTGPGD